MSSVSDQDDSSDVPTLQFGSIIKTILKISLVRQAHHQRG